LTRSKLGVLTLAVAILAITVAGGYTIDVFEDISNDDLGWYLVDEGGLALYYYEGDAPGTGISNLYTNDSWKAFYTEIIDVPGDLESLDFKKITGYDGEDQIAYHNWPLYLFTEDENEGDHKGHNQILDDGNKMKLLDPMEFPPEE